MSQGLVRSLSVGSCVSWVASKVMGVSGGILICWDTKVIQLVELEEGRFTLSYKFKNCQDDFTWALTRVYGLMNDVDRGELWEDLGAIRGIWREP